MNKYFKHLFYNNQQSTINNSFFLFFFILPIFACTPDPPPTLNYKDRKMVDSLFKKEVEYLKPILDSICDARFDSTVAYTVDSIMKERQSEIEKYLERLKKEQLENNLNQ